MKPTLLLLLLLPLLFLAVAEANKDSGESHEANTRRHTCAGLVQEPPKPTKAASSETPKTVPTPAPGQCYCSPASPEGSGEDNGSGEGSGEGDGFHSDCVLVEAFYNMSIYLSVEQQVLWEAWIQEVENTILVNISLSEEEKVVYISLSLKAFFSLNIDIYNVLSYKKIANWGNCEDFLHVSIQIQIEITQSIVVLDSESSCVLFEALESACTPDDQSACNELMLEIQGVLEDTSFTYEQQLAVVFKVFKKFFGKHPDMEKLLKGIHIKAYGPLQAFLDVCETYERITTLTTVISGSSSSECVLLEALEAAMQNSSFTASAKVQINQLKEKFQLFFSANLDISVRLEYISATCYQMFLLEPWMIEIVEQVECGEWGSIYEIIFCSGICTNHGCGNPNNGPGPQQSSSTLASSSVGPSVGPTPKAGDCNSVGSLIVVDVVTNTTLLTNVLLDAYNNKFTAAQRLGANSCLNNIRKAIWDNVAFPDQHSKLIKIQQSLWAYNNNSVTQQDLIFNLTISTWGGMVRDFVKCIH